MTTSYDKNNFTLFRISTDKNLFVAVANEYLPKIKHAVKEFGDLKSVPSDWEVRGIFVEATKSKNITFDPDAQQNEIVMNSLVEFEKLP